MPFNEPEKIVKNAKMKIIKGLNGLI